MKTVAENLVSIIHESFANLEKLSDDIASRKPAPEKWSPKELIGHLIDSATNNHNRFIRAQETAELNFPKYEQNSWVNLQKYNDTSWNMLLNLWKYYNLHIAHVIRTIQEEHLSTLCVIGDYEPVTLEFLVTDYVSHMEHHLGKLFEQVR